MFKDPITDPGKKSFKGRVTLYKDGKTGKLYTSREIDYTNRQAHGMKDELVTVFENGRILKEWKFEEIRERSNAS